MLKNKVGRSIWLASLILASLASMQCVSIAAGQPAHAKQAPGTFQNPVLWEDLADLDILRVDDVFYYSASNMHYSPGAPILRSYDLVHWEYVGHSIPVLDFSPAYDLNGARAYVKGSWASFFGYRKSNRSFYWGGCIGFSKTHIYTAPAAEGPWSKKAILDDCYYDAGLLIDDDDTPYVAYGNTTLHVAQLSADATHQVRSEVVFQTPPSIGVLEGSRFYKIHGNYYIFTTRPANAEYVLRSTTGPFGPYQIRPLLVDAKSPVSNSGVPHQGGIVETPKGDWYYMAFIDAYPGGRVPVLAPLTWDKDGWPSAELPGNQWLASYPLPDIGASAHPLRSLTGTDLFAGSALGPEWEWNHNPDVSKFRVQRGLVLRTATLTRDLYSARNTLTHRILGPVSTATIQLNDKHMTDGDRAGLVMLRDSSAWIGLTRDDGKTQIAVVNNITMDKHWNTASTGTQLASVPVTAKRVWLRVRADVHPGPGHTAVFSYSLDGTKFLALGPPFLLNANWPFFMGYRFGIFNYATRSLGGSVKIHSFTLDGPTATDSVELPPRGPHKGLPVGFE
jgi:beta-xylosidase